MESSMVNGGIVQAVQHQDQVLDNLLSDLLLLCHEFNVYKAHNACQLCQTSSPGKPSEPALAGYRCRGVLGRDQPSYDRGFPQGGPGTFSSSSDSLPSLLLASE